MKNALGKTIVVTFAMLLSACRAEYTNISNDPELSKFIGQKYRLTSDMDYSGVNLQGYSDEIHMYFISSRDPGWSGPEVITRKTLPAGSILTINKVEECINCWDFGVPLRHALVTIERNPKEDLPVKLDLDQIISAKHVEQIQ